MLNIHVCREDLYVHHLPGLVECRDLECVPYLDLTLKQGVGHDGAHHTTPQYHSVVTTHLTWSRVPVMTVPWPLMAKQWSTARSAGPATTRAGTYECRWIAEIRPARPEEVGAGCRTCPSLILAKCL